MNTLPFSTDGRAAFYPSLYVWVLNERERAIKRSFQNRNSIHVHSEGRVSAALPQTQEHMISTQCVVLLHFFNSFCSHEAFMLWSVGLEVNLNNITKNNHEKANIFACSEEKVSAPALTLSKWCGNCAVGLSDLSLISNSSLIRIKSLDSMLVIAI